MQEAASEVQGIYRNAGLTINSADVMPDHIGAELSFLSVLLERMHSEPETRYDNAEIAGKFLDEHLRKWVPEFARDMEEAADTPIYKSLARATVNLIALITDQGIKMNLCNEWRACHDGSQRR